jgi:type III restriction enzyme
MYTLLEFQEKAVNKLQECVITAISDGRQQTPVLLKAPTGAGKTVMAAALIERVVDQAHLHPGLDSNMAFIWFAPNTLHIQSYTALSKFYEESRRLNCIDLNNLTSDPVLNPGDLLFVNWASLSNKNNIWRKENESKTNLETLIENTKANSTKIILIIDEAHLSAFTGKQAIAVRYLIAADIELLITATENNVPDLNVIVNRNDVIRQQLIKKSVRLNIGLNPAQQNSDNVNIHLLRKAFEKKAELQRLYDKEVGYGVVNPLILIQLPSDSTALSEEDKSVKENVEYLLNSEFNISTNNGKLAVWLSGEKETAGLEELNGFQDVLIFKQAIAQGWDCPRAAILLNYRTIGSPNFGIQTVGRILRMPHRKHYLHDELNHGYVYTDIQTSQIRLVPDDIDYIERFIAVRKENSNWVYDTLQTARITNDRDTPSTLNSIFQSIFFNVMEERYRVKQLIDVDIFTERTEEENQAQKEKNTDLMREHGWRFDIDTHQITIPTDITIDEYQVNSIIEINKTNSKAFAITSEQFSKYFDRFCYDCITRLIKEKSWRQMRSTLINFAEFYLESFEFDARKIFLYPYNKRLLIADINIALERFDEWQRAKGNENRRVEYTDWEIPKERFYNENHNGFDVDSHALDPFYEQVSASKPEKLFKQFLITNEDKIDYWYKNGDAGREHFSVDYLDLSGKKRLFYVDFIIKMKSGKIGFFDTKSLRSDIDASNKHNALRKWMSENGSNYIGGVIIPVETAGIWNFYYSEFDLVANKYIENTTGFTALNFNNI